MICAHRALEALNKCIPHALRWLTNVFGIVRLYVRVVINIKHTHVRCESHASSCTRAIFGLTDLPSLPKRLNGGVSGLPAAAAWKSLAMAVLLMLHPEWSDEIWFISFIQYAHDS